MKQRLVLSEAERAEIRRAGVWMVLTALLGIFIAVGGVISMPLSIGAWVFGIIAGGVALRILLSGLELRSFARSGQVEQLESFAETLARVYYLRLLGSLVPLVGLMALAWSIYAG